jgi:hypothetical protein
VDDKQLCPNVSEAEVLEKVRLKVRNGMYVFGPQVLTAIENLKKLKRLKAVENPDREYRTVIDIDIADCILCGVGTEITPLTTEPQWAVTIKSVNSEGYPLVVHVYLNYDEREPLLISSFVPCEKGEA